ncbi:Coa1p [Rhodotorula paludigena]|uniref:Coa1p n=1 Tax=Rhodotorula paludigena TaxID=86838 RepID=UPI00317D1C53
MLGPALARPLRAAAHPLALPRLVAPLAAPAFSTPRHSLSTSSAAHAAAREPLARPATGRRRAHYQQQGERDLPELKSRAPLYLSLALISAGAWGLFLAYATNNERANSSVVRSLAFQLRSWPAVKDFLGDGVKIEPLVADFVRIKGSINMLAGRIDVQFPVRGSKARGTASFTSIRRGKEGRFEVLRWKITREDGAVLDLAGLDLSQPVAGLE